MEAYLYSHSQSIYHSDQDSLHLELHLVDFRVQLFERLVLSSHLDWMQFQDR